MRSGVFKLALIFLLSMEPLRLPAQFDQLMLIDVNSGISQGAITAEANCVFDIGNISNIFDGNTLTLARSPAVNPLIITLSFKDSIAIAKSRIYTQGAQGKWTLEAALNTNDIESKTGSYSLVIDQGDAIADDWVDAEFTPVPARILRLTLLRTVGDDYVHLNEWEIYNFIKYEALVIEPDSLLLHPSWQKTITKIGFATSDGYKKIENSELTWSSSNPEIAIVSPEGKITALSTGNCKIKAKYNNLETNCELIVGNGSRSVIPGDLDVLYISRIPIMDYVWGSWNPTRDGLPAEDKQIRWVAHVINRSNIDRKNIKYLWTSDGNPAAEVLVDLPPLSEIEIELLWNWKFERHIIAFKIDYDNKIAEEDENNNSLSIYSDAITVAFYVEEGIYNYFREYQHELAVGANSLEDWAQRQISRWNKMCDETVFPESPKGVLDRIRIDKIVVTPDSALPMTESGLSTNSPNTDDRTVDLQWGFPVSLLNSDFYSNHSTAEDFNPFYFEGSLLHELGHARYLIDVYGFNVHDDGKGGTVAIRENGKLISGTEFMPFIANDALYYTPIRGLMNSDYTYIDRYSAAALNLISGHRATLGNYNPPGNIGVFLLDLPEENKLIVKDSNGEPLPYANVKIYRADGFPNVWYGKHYDNIPDMEMTADSVGAVLLGRCPFDEYGNIKHAFGKSNCVLIIRVEIDGKAGYGFLDITSFNLQYWSGDSALGQYEIKVKLLPINTSVEPSYENCASIISSFHINSNPISVNAVIEYEISKPADLSLKIYDIYSREYKTMESGFAPAGIYHKFLNPEKMPVGAYFAVLRAGNEIRVIKFIKCY